MGTIAAHPGCPALTNTFHHEASMITITAIMKTKNTPLNRIAKLPSKPVPSLFILVPSANSHEYSRIVNWYRGVGVMFQSNGAVGMVRGLKIAVNTGFTAAYEIYLRYIDP